MQDICKQVPLVGDDWLVLWNEYEEQNTESAVIVKHLDKFDMVAQALDYEFKYGNPLHNCWQFVFYSFQESIFLNFLSLLKASSRSNRSSAGTEIFVKEGSKQKARKFYLSINSFIKNDK